jgi:6-phosphogluconolactonase
MRIEVLADAEAAARRAAAYIAAQARAAVESRGLFTLAVSGGRTPHRMLELLADEQVPWDVTHIFQADERVAPAGSPERNLTRIAECLGRRVSRAAGQLHAMPVGDPDLAVAAARYAHELAEVAGSPPVLDLVHLGLGEDGHTASLVPGDPVLDVADADVAPSGPYLGRSRMTVTYPLLNRARRILWLVTGAEKMLMLARLQAADPSIPAGRVNRERALIVADAAAASPERS